MHLDKFNTENFSKLEEKLNKMLDTKWFYGILIISVILYIQVVKINVDPRLHRFLNSNLFRLFAFSVIDMKNSYPQIEKANFSKY